MLKIWFCDPVTGEMVLNTPELKLINEFNDLWALAKEQCGCTGRGNSDAQLKFGNYCKYVYLCSDWSSPYDDYPEDEKKYNAIVDSYMDDDEFRIAEPLLIKACKKISDMQNKDRNIRILRAGQSQIDDLIEFYSKEGKLNETVNGKPKYNPKDISQQLQELGSLSDSLDAFEDRVRHGEKSKSNLRSGAVEGLIIDFQMVKKKKEMKFRQMEDEKKKSKDGGIDGQIYQ